MLREFKEFAMRGNMLDMAVGIVVGGAFGRIVTSLVNDVLMPPIGLVLARVDFTNLFLPLSRREFHTLAEAKAAGVPTLNYGLFLNNIVDFLIVAFAIFLLVREVNAMKRRWEPQPAAPPPTKQCPYCISTIPLQASRCPQCTSALAQA